MVWLQMMDCATTLFALHHMGAIELNPFVNFVLSMPLGWLWFILGKVVLGGTLFVWLWMRKRAWAIWTVLVFYTLVVVWNLSLIGLGLFI